MLCRRAAAPTAAPQSRALSLLVVILVLLTAAGIAVKVSDRRSKSSVVSSTQYFPSAAKASATITEPQNEPAAVPAVRGILNTTNSAERSGAYFLPSGFQGRPLPLLVAIHGTGGNGAGSVALLASAAEARHFIVVAPDSRFAPNGQASWQVADAPGDITDDFTHIQRCVEEVRALPGVAIDTNRTLIVGHSGGGSTAPYVASQDEFYTAFAVLHGGVFAGGLGPHRPRGWFSTGDEDPLRPPSSVEAAAQAVRSMGFTAIEYRTFHESHDIGADELRAVLAWWLGSRE